MFYSKFFSYAFFSIVILHSSSATNVTFNPEPIRLTIADLPRFNTTPSATKGSIIVEVPRDPKLLVPNGFVVKTWMTNLIKPRLLLESPSGDILVSESGGDRISCLIDNDLDGFPDERITFADKSNKLNYPYGMAFQNDSFYVANRDGIRRYSWTHGSRKIDGEGELLLSLNPMGHRTRSLLLSPVENKMYIGIGSLTDHDADPLPKASVQIANLDGTNQSTFAFGLRNPTSLAFHPITKELYVACQERDEIGDDLVPDFLTRIQQDQFFGWPFAYLSRDLIDPRYRFENGSSTHPDLVQATTTPDVLFQAHSAVLDMKFYTGTQFPTRYRNGAFAAFHGSWNRMIGTGYKVVFIPFGDDNRPKGYYENFLDGFLVDPSGPDTFATPVGILVQRNGSLLITDDANNRIYQVQYMPNSATFHQNYLSSVFLALLLLLSHCFS